MSKAMYVGSFDPITMGHLDIIERSSRIFDELIIAVGVNTNKTPIFSVTERTNFLKEITQKSNNINIVAYEGLTVDLLKNSNVDVLIRGIRNGTDLDHEKAIFGMNKHLNSEIETVFMPSLPKYDFISSSLIKEVVKMGGEVDGLVPQIIVKPLKDRLKKDR